MMTTMMKRVEHVAVAVAVLPMLHLRFDDQIHSY